MHNMIKISEAASLALHTMALLASCPGEKFSTKVMASRLGVSEAHLAKVLQRLGREGLVRSRRGPKGGFVLAKNPADVTLLEVYEAAEGPLVIRDCLLQQPVCQGHCILGNLLVEISERVRNYFSNTTLADLTEAFGCEVASA